MEKLEPIIRNRFWILSGLVVILSLAGWWMASSSLATTIDTRTKEIKAAEDKIPKGNVPSADYSNKLSTINTYQERQVELARTMLWDQQRAKMAWPKNIQPYADEAGYRGEFAPLARDIYRTSSPSDIASVWQKVRPFNAQTGEGVVVFPLQAMPVKYWRDLPPTSKEMWDAQEDLWLLDSLLSTITQLNGGETTNNRLDASIHQILKLQLMGGKRGEPIDAPAAGGDPSGGGGEGYTPPMALGGDAFSSGGGGRGGKIASPTSADFPIKEEFGTAGGEGGLNGSSSSADSFAADPSALGDGAPQMAAARRYIDDDEGAPFRTRGFYLSVLMDHRRIPDFIAELTSNERSVWPVEVVRVQMIRKNEDGNFARGGASGLPNYGAEAGSFGGSSPSFGTASEGFTGGGANNVPPEFLTQSQGINPQDANNPMLMNKIQAANAALQTALSDPNIAEVVIAGYFTLYNPPQTAPEAAATSADSTATPAAPATSETPAGTEATTPEMTNPAPAENPPVDGATPAAPAAPTNPAPTDPAPTDPAATPPANTPPAAPTAPATTPAAPAGEPVPSVNVPSEAAPATPPAGGN
ncbi:hypothetical protein Spb1_08470 [Planctopirus ephydatiae]|uniref:Uncharacterized protein n=1 Tax=Planctopirus ephydatiae TaxID=2528019 RepID=A0A518GK57_9PLAN|nr:hypothetical protein [Planctopirus ephydatiae]QDV28980.1 hypothetical protein Spb1_08470 [Planctopirus ephydatiae]